MKPFPQPVQPKKKTHLHYNNNDDNNYTYIYIHLNYKHVLDYTQKIAFKLNIFFYYPQYYPCQVKGGLLIAISTGLLFHC